jgi:hypothetical protein
VISISEDANSNEARLQNTGCRGNSWRDVSRASWGGSVDDAEASGNSVGYGKKGTIDTDNIRETGIVMCGS